MSGTDPWQPGGLLRGCLWQSQTQEGLAHPPHPPPVTAHTHRSSFTSAGICLSKSLDCRYVHTAYRVLLLHKAPYTACEEEHIELHVHLPCRCMAIGIRTHDIKANSRVEILDLASNESSSCSNSDSFCISPDWCQGGHTSGVVARFVTQPWTSSLVQVRKSTSNGLSNSQL